MRTKTIALRDLKLYDIPETGDSGEVQIRVSESVGTLQIESLGTLQIDSFFLRKNESICNVPNDS